MRNKSSAKASTANKIPARYLQFQRSYPKVFKAYDALGAATQESGPLPHRSRALIKLAIAVGARLEGAVHSHTRRALAAGCTPEEIRHTVLLATTTLGFPSMMACLSWVDDVLKTRP
jgi:alkylhydroperoxidase/carboxymuconolactone decarboxylase family protein YurZ